MKHLYALLMAAAALTGQAQAQCLMVYEGQVATAIPATEAYRIAYADGGQTLTVGNATFATAGIDSIVGRDNEVTANMVQVDYSDGRATVTLPVDLRPLLQVTASAADVSIVASAALTDEVTYTLAGSAADGSFFMDGEYKATLTLNNLTLTNLRGAAIDIACGKRIDVKLPEGTHTTLTDAVGGTHSACFFINGHAEFSGGGKLTLMGRTKHAYASDEYTLLKASTGTIEVLSAVSDGLHIDQYFEMRGGQVTIDGVGGDCIDVSCTKDATDELNGQAFMSGGTLVMNVAADDVKGIKTENAFHLSGGTLQATVSGLGTKGISTGTDLTIDSTSGSAPQLRMTVSGTTYMPGDATLESKCRGIKVKGNFTFDGGDIYMEVTGSKAKGISVDGLFNYKSGTSNVFPE